MKPIVVANQVRLGPRRCLQLAISGMGYRLFRSLVTTSILALAVAFLVHMLGYGILENATRRDAWQQLRSQQRLGELLGHLTQPDSVDNVLEALAGPYPRRHDEYARWAKLDEQAMAAVRRTASDLIRLERDLKRLPATAQATLLSDLAARQQLRSMTHPDALEEFLSRVDSLGVRLRGHDAPSLRELLVDRQATLNEAIAAIRAGHAEAIQRVAAAAGEIAGMPYVRALRTQPTTLAPAMDAAGFKVRQGDLEAMAAFMQRQRRLAEVSRQLSISRTRLALAKQLGVPPQEVEIDMLLGRATNPGTAEALVATFQNVEPGVTLSARTLSELAQHYQRYRALEAIVGDRPPSGEGGWFGLSWATWWLIALAGLVCTVGVANAMFMSVTERFYEIATMKCLGALDGFIMTVFVFEAIVHGLVGGIVGMIVGLLLVGLRGGATYGGAFAQWHAMGELTLAVLMALVIGIILAILASIGPAYLASRLAPMEAMRVE